MVTPKLFDIVAITRLRTIEEDFNPNYMDGDTIKFSERKTTYTLYTAKHHNKANEDVVDEEHIAFLNLWLSRCIFCGRSL